MQTSGLKQRSCSEALNMMPAGNQRTRLSALLQLADLCSRLRVCQHQQGLQAGSGKLRFASAGQRKQDVQYTGHVLHVSQDAPTAAALMHGMQLTDQMSRVQVKASVRKLSSSKALPLQEAKACSLLAASRPGARHALGEDAMLPRTISMCTTPFCRPPGRPVGRVTTSLHSRTSCGVCCWKGAQVTFT